MHFERLQAYKLWEAVVPYFIPICHVVHFTNGCSVISLATREIDGVWRPLTGRRED